MSNPILTPKKAFIFVPGHGVVERADFTQDHARIILKRGESAGVSQDKTIAQHFTLSIGDLPLFEDQDPDQVKPKTKAKSKTKTDDEVLEEMIKEEQQSE